jgi:hypothetical protein
MASNVTTAARFCSGRLLLKWNSVPVWGLAALTAWVRVAIPIAQVLIERWNASCVEVMMSRARTIVVSLIPAMLLVTSVNCFSDLVCGCARDHSGSGLFAGGHNQQHAPASDNSFDQVVGRWSRRINTQPGSDEFSSPVLIARPQYVFRIQTVGSCDCSRLTLSLAQCWQFHWRTALEPRAPSLVSSFRS